MAENQVSVVREEQSLMSVPASDSYASFVAETKEQKMALYNALMNADERLGDHINETIELKEVIIEKIELVDEDTGEVVVAPRTVVIDSKGKAYEAVSVGVFSALKRIINIFGEPSAWDTPIKVKIIQKTIKKNKMLTLEIVA